MLNPYTTFAGYAIPHPSIFSMNLRIETVSNVEADGNNCVLDLRQISSSPSEKKKKSKGESVSNTNIGATQILLKSCDDLENICDTIENKFDKAVELFFSNKN
ncbi:hypothetical protein FG386_003331 [Cryptosporidium ryanae]|uniref:uncharacterized protein n=1 Tax=Cryptosporidium ryanae TaxID=515981 RepID=UPI00351A4093|nr:hypothetical protein FG386_003331 [Cryptosporidium ryanae]